MPKEVHSPVDGVLEYAKKTAPAYAKKDPRDIGRWALLNFRGLEEEKKITDTATGLAPKGTVIGNYAQAIGIIFKYDERISRLGSLDKPVGESEDSPGIGRFIPDENANDPESGAIQSSLRDVLRELMEANLTPQQQRIMGSIYDEGKLQNETGEEIGMGRTGVYRLHKMALEKLREAISQRNGLEEELKKHLS